MEGNKTGISLGFEAESLDGMMELVKEKGIEITETFQPGPDFRFFFIKDPNGVTIHPASTLRSSDYRRLSQPNSPCRVLARVLP